MSHPLLELEAWFVTGSQDLYGEAVLRKVDENARHIARCLDEAAAVPVRIVPRPVVTTPEAIAAVLRDADADPACVGVVAWMHTFSPAKMWIGGLTDLRKPLVHLHTQYNRDLPWADIDMDFMNLNQAAHGDREFAFIQTRLRRGRKTIVGHWEDPAVLGRLGWWSRAAAGWHESRRLKIARFGDNMRHVAVTEGDKVEAQARLGFSVNGYGVSELVERVGAVGDAAVDDLVGQYEDQYDVAMPLRRGGERHAELRTAARIEGGLRSFIGEGGFGAFTDTFEDLDGLEQLPGIGVQRLMADGYGFGAEGDWKAAALVRILKVMGEGLPGGTSFMEDYTYHLGDPVPEVLGAHMLEVCPSLTSDRPSCEIHPLSIGGRSRPGPARVRRGARPGGHPRPGRPRRPVQADRERGRRCRGGCPAAEAARGARRLAATTEPRDRGRGVADGRRSPPHGDDEQPQHRTARRLRRDRRYRARDDRRIDETEGVRAGAAVEPGLLLPQSRSLGVTAGTGPVAAVAPTAAAIATYRPIGATDVTVTAGFWADRLATNGQRTIAVGFEQLERAGNLHNFRLAAGKAGTGGYRALGLMFDKPFPFLDSDVYKWLEGVAWELGRAPDARLRSMADEAIGLLEARPAR